MSSSIISRFTLRFNVFLNVLLRLSPAGYDEFSRKMLEKIKPNNDSKSENSSPDPKMKNLHVTWWRYRFECKDSKEFDNKKARCTALVEFLNTAMAVLFQESKIPLMFYDGSETPVSGSHTERGPDVGVVSASHRFKEVSNEKRWPVLIYFIQVKQRSTDYALDMLSAGIIRNHSIGMAIHGDQFQLAYHDRSIVVLSERLNLFEDVGLLRLLAVLHQLGELPRLTRGPFPPDDWNSATMVPAPVIHGSSEGTLNTGAATSEATAVTSGTTVNEAGALSGDTAGSEGTATGDGSAVAASDEEDSYPMIIPNFNPNLLSQSTTKGNKKAAIETDAHPDSDAFLGCKLTLERDVELELQELIYRARSIIGRGTTVLRAKCPPELKKKWNHHSDDVVVKISFPGERQEAEDDMCAKALYTANELGEDHSWVKNNLPNILYSKTYEYTDDMPQCRIFAYLKSIKMGHTYEMRKPRITVQEVLSPITELKSWVEFVQVFLDVLQVHRWLVDHPRILHCDLSQANIMFRRTDKRVYGVLNDFDLSLFLRPNGRPSSQKRSGTKPFMSPELLSDKVWTPGHLYRHDLEGLFYVMLILCCHHGMIKGSSGVHLMQNRPFDVWFTYSAEIVCAMKNELYASPRTPPVTNFFKPFEPCLQTLLTRLSRGYARKMFYLSDFLNGAVDPSALDGKILTFDWDTLDNNVTYEVFIEALLAIGGDAVETVYLRTLPLRRKDLELPYALKASSFPDSMPMYRYTRFPLYSRL